MADVYHKDLTGTDLHVPKAHDNTYHSTNYAASGANTDITSLALTGSINPTNLLSNGDFEAWSAGANAAPDGWTLSGASATAAREGTIIKLGTYSAKVTRAGTDCQIYQAIHTAKGIAYWKGRTVTFGCWVYATVADRARIRLDDGVTVAYSSYHTGDSTWQWLTQTFTVDSTATYLQARLFVDTGDTSAYFDGAICVEGESAFAFSDKPLAYNDTRFKVGNFTRNTATESGDQSVTGVGFRPKAMFTMCVQDGSDEVSWGMVEGSNSGGFALQDSGNFTTHSAAFYLYESSGTAYSGVVKSWDADGFTITWTKTGSPTGTLTCYFIALR